MTARSYKVQKFIFALLAGLFGWVWMLSIPLAIGHFVYSFFNTNEWLTSLQILLVGAVAKFLLRGFRDNLERVNLEYYLITEKNFDPAMAYKCWKLAYGDGGAEGHSRVLAVYQITDEQLNVMNSMFNDN